MNENIQFMMEFLKNPFLILIFSTINDLRDDAISDIATYAHVPLFILSVTRHLICGNN